MSCIPTLPLHVKLSCFHTLGWCTIANKFNESSWLDFCKTVTDITHQTKFNTWNWTILKAPLAGSQSYHSWIIWTQPFTFTTKGNYRSVYLLPSCPVIRPQPNSSLSHWLNQTLIRPFSDCYKQYWWRTRPRCQRVSAPCLCIHASLNTPLLISISTGAQTQQSAGRRALAGRRGGRNRKRGGG